ELGVAVGVLDGQATAGQYAGLAFGCAQSTSSDGERGRPGGRLELAAVRIAYERPGEAIGLTRVHEREAVLVGDPLLVHLGVVTGETTHHLAATMIDPDRRAASVVLGDRRRRDQVERT